MKLQAPTLGTISLAVVMFILFSATHIIGTKLGEVSTERFIAKQCEADGSFVANGKRYLCEEYTPKYSMKGTLRNWKKRKMT